MRAKYRVGFATFSIFVAIFGIFAAIRGVVFDQDSFLRYGIAALISGVAGFVVFLNPREGMDDELTGHHRK
jgi:membrane associated rhomboid family serine protease